MGMTHTTLESRFYAQPLTSHDTLLSSSTYSSKSSTPGLSPINEESSGSYFNDVFDSSLQSYEYTMGQTLNTDEFYFSNPSPSDPCYSYTVIPTDTFPDDLSIKTDLAPKTYIFPIENYPLPENYAIYEQPLDLYQPSLSDAKSNILYDTTNVELFEDIGLQTKQIYDSPIAPYDPPIYDTIEADTSETVPTIRLLYADEPSDLITQFQTADYQSMLSWQDILRVSGDFTFSNFPSQLAEHMAGAILMEEQVTDNVYHTGKLLVWEKLSKFVQSMPELYHLSKLELNCLWENNKEAMFFFTLGEIMNSSLNSFQEQLEGVKLFKFNEFDESGSFNLAPAVSINLLSRIFNIIFPESKRYEVEENIRSISNYPNDRIISCFVLTLIFISLDKVEQDTEKESFLFKLQSIQLKIETSLRSFLDSHFGNSKDLFDQCMQKIIIAKKIPQL